MGGKRTDLTGMRFGRLVAVEYKYTNDRRQPVWLFHCDCGNDKIMSASNVRWGGVRSCGCLHREHTASINRVDITGNRYDRLVAIRPTEDRDAAGSIVWEMQCDCGNKAYYSVNALNGGHIRSCGCVYRETRTEAVKMRKDMVEDTNLSALVAAKKVRKNNTSGITGVYLLPNGKYEAYINFQKKRYTLGCFATKEAAARARKEAEHRLHDPILKEYEGVLTKRTKESLHEYLTQGMADTEGINDTI